MYTNTLRYINIYYLFIIIVILLLLLILLFCFIIFAYKQQVALRHQVLESKPITAKYFLDHWIDMKNGKTAVTGFKTMDQPGCYVILINPRHDNRGKQIYDNVYIGQSLKVCSRVRSHLTGHGNGDVYADVRSNQNVVIRILTCNKTEMNEKEKTLIAAFHATSSYNRTRGGSTKR